MVMFDSFEKLERYIHEEMKRNDVRIVRFINVNSLEMWTKLVAMLRDVSGKTLALSEFCADSDLTPNINRLMDELKITRKTSLLLPLSEHLRIVKRDEAFLSKLLKLEYSRDSIKPNTRIFIPMYRMKSGLLQLSNEDKRFENNILFLETTEDRDYSLTIVDNKIDVAFKGNNIQGYREYLRYWEHNPSKPIILHTQFAGDYSNNILTDNLKVLVTPFDLLSHCYSLGNLLKESWGKEWQWQRLVNLMKEKASITDVFKEIFAIPKYDAKVLIAKWKTATDFERWLIWLWMKIEAKSGYLSLVLNEDGITTDSFIDSIINGIFEVDVKDLDSWQYKELYAERKEYLKLLGLDNLPAVFWTKLETLKPTEKLYFLTDCTIKERIEILCIVGQVKLSDKVKSLIELVYPVLYKYLQNNVLNRQEFSDYIKQYKIQKIENSVNDSFIELVKKYAAQKGIWWGLESRNKLVEVVYDDSSVIFWVDALGVEYLDLIAYLLETNFSDVYYDIQIGYANLPTTTEKNNDFAISRNVIEFRMLDEAKHSYTCVYPEYIVKEFELIKTALKQAVGSLNDYDKVIITSDHGASRLAVIYSGTTHKAKDGAVIEKCGRYCIDGKNDYGNEIAGCIDRDEFHVFADYDRFSISGGAKGEIHGGASLEEVLIPIIQLSKKPFDFDNVTITLLTPQIRLRAGQKPKVIFKLDRTFQKVETRMLDKQYICVKENDYWYFEPEIGKGEVFSARVIAHGRILGNIEFRVIKGISSNMDI